MKRKPTMEWDEVTKNLSKKELKKLGGELSCIMAAFVREEIDNCMVEAMRTGTPPKGLMPMNIPDTPEGNEYKENMKKMGDVGTKLLKKYERTNKKTK
jgi:hypothetical protein